MIPATYCIVAAIYQSPLFIQAQYSGNLSRFRELSPEASVEQTIDLTL